MPRGKNNLKPAKLVLWQQRLSQSDEYWQHEVDRMNWREKLYAGQRKLTPLVPGETRKNGLPKKTSHVRNIVFENIESQVSSTIPAPKVTPRRQKDERKAALIEHMLRNEVDRLPFEQLNDLAERTVPIQGGTLFLVEWNNTKGTHDTVGEVEVQQLHPKQLAPQPGIYTGIQDMDWVILKLPTTKEDIRREFGVDVSDQMESEPQVRGSGDEDTAEDALTKYVGYAKNDKGGIDRYVWVNDIELEDLENYQARRQPVCKRCGRVRPLVGQVLSNSVSGGVGDLLPDPATGAVGGLIPPQLEQQAAGVALASRMAMDTLAGAPGGLGDVPVEAGPAPEEPKRYDGGPCPWCGGDEWTTQEQEFEQIMLPIRTRMGTQIPGMHPAVDELGRAVMEPTQVPFYRPDVYPLVLQKSVSVYGQLLGNSDVDQIQDQQNTVNRMEQKIIDRLVKAGTRITLPAKASLRTDPEDGERWFLDSPADKSMIDVLQFSGDLQYELMYLANVYEEARQILGITDSFQGRADSTATSGKAKEFSAAQAAGRLESKRVMKEAAYAEIYKAIFQMWLAYSDEPRTIAYTDPQGNTQYEEFNRYDFLEQDANGNWFWNDQFLFSTDTNQPLASNREAMWQETRMNLQTGAFGDPAQTETLILFWSKMEALHYPGAAETKSWLEDKLRREQEMAARQAQMQQMQMQMAAAQAEQAGRQRAQQEIRNPAGTAAAGSGGRSAITQSDRA